VASLASFASLALALAGSLVAPPALAAPKDAQAEKALKKALDDDYLDTRFDEAIKRLDAAIEACGADGCSKEVKAKLYFALGAVHASGKKQLDDARDAFVEGLKLDASGKVPQDLASTETSFAFEQAKKQLKLGAPTASEGAGLEHVPHPAQKRGTPLPIYAVVSQELDKSVDKVRITYRPPGADEWKTQNLRALGQRGHGTNVPCADLRQEGRLVYYLSALDSDQRVVASLGSEKKPLSTAVSADFAGEAPHWPGYEAPASCSDDKPRKMGDGKKCVEQADCPEGEKCAGDTCVRKGSFSEGEPEPPKPEGDKPRLRRNWLTLTYSLDLPFFEGADVCSPGSRKENGEINAGYLCFQPDGTRYTATPELGQGNNVKLGAVLGTMRVKLGYDRVLGDAFTIGLRLGVVFNGAPEELIPIHAEARLAYWLGKDPFLSPARPFLFLAGGLGQVDAGIDVQALRLGTTDQVDALRAYKQMGPGFAGGGLGIVYAPVPAFGLHLAVRGAVTFPVVAAVIQPEAGFAVGF
jgi:hypothetical protein